MHLLITDTSFSCERWWGHFKFTDSSCYWGSWDWDSIIQLHQSNNPHPQLGNVKTCPPQTHKYSNDPLTTHDATTHSHNSINDGLPYKNYSQRMQCQSGDKENKKNHKMKINLRLLMPWIKLSTHPCWVTGLSLFFFKERRKKSLLLHIMIKLGSLNTDCACVCCSQCMSVCVCVCVCVCARVPGVVT